MPIDYTKDYLTKSQQTSSLSLLPASMSGGGKALVMPSPPQIPVLKQSMSGQSMSGGGYVGVSFLPQRPIGGMLGRLSYGPKCTPLFYGEILQRGGKKSKSKSESEGKKDDCDCKCSKEDRIHIDNVKKLFMMNGGGGGAGLITQFSAISQVSPLFASMSMTNVISIILLFFAHSYAIQYGQKKSMKSKMMGGGIGTPILFSQILQPLGMSNLVAIASLLLLHYFAVRNKRLHMMSGGGKEFGNAFQSNVIQNELRIQDMIGGSSIYKELKDIFLEDSSSIIGGGKKSKLHEAIKPLEKDQYIASGMMRLLKGLLSNFYNTQYKNKKSSKSASKKTFLFFKRIFNTITPVSVAIYIRKKEESKSKKIKKIKKIKK
jgi:hypothetical protein